MKSLYSCTINERLRATEMLIELYFRWTGSFLVFVDNNNNNELKGHSCYTSRVVDRFSCFLLPPRNEKWSFE